MMPQTNLDEDAARGILAEYKIANADVIFRCDATIDDLIDVIEGNRFVFSFLFLFLLIV